MDPHEPAATTAGESGYLPIAEHGLIGDLRTAALVGSDGTIDWFCAPQFDSPSVFGSILDHDGGGAWRITPALPTTSRQFYLPDSNVLITRFFSAEGVVEVEDFMPILRAHDDDHHQRLVRRLRAVRGRMSLTADVEPRFDYGRSEHSVDAVAADGAGHVVRFTSPSVDLQLSSSVPLVVRGTDVSAEIELTSGREVTFVLDVLCGPDPTAPAPADAEDLLHRTMNFWQQWLASCTYTGRWREAVVRSALVLKLLCHEPTGAIVAAPTMGLPEELGGERNWDYRYVWMRDAAFSLYALLRLGFTDEAEAFMDWLTERFTDGSDSPGPEGPLRVMYTIDGENAGEEIVLDHWEGHRRSAPVRVRNDAADQLQLDIYGDLIDSIYLFNKYGAGISLDAWASLSRLVEWLREHWDQPDEGIWEQRSGRQEHTFSRLMCWVAVERMVRMATQRGLPADLTEWTSTRDEMHAAILERGWNAERRAFVQAFDSDVLDASLLLMPMVKFLAPTDPKFVSTVEAIEATLVTDSLVFRYDGSQGGDGLSGTEGTFSMCSFWYVEALTRIGRLADARLALEKMFTYANPVGLYAEQIGLSGEQLGNFPQAFTHLSLISAVINLDRALG